MLSVETPTRTRTRTAILKAATTVLAANQAAALGDIADAAGVARSTVHRYFPERDDLLTALRAYAQHEIDAATERARIGEGPALDALVRLGHEYFDHWETLIWTYLDSVNGDDDHMTATDADPALTALIERGYADGTIAPGATNLWLQQIFWAFLYATAEYVRAGGTKHEALALTLAALRRVAAPER